MEALTVTPGYWMNEKSGVLRPAVEAYLAQKPMSQDQIAAMRAYLRQWINAPMWSGPTVAVLRGTVDDLLSRGAICTWLAIAEREGVDPL